MCYKANGLNSKFYNTVNDLITVPCLRNNATNTVTRTVAGLKRYKPGHEGPRPEGEEELLETWGLKNKGEPLTQEALDFWESTTESRDGYLIIYDQDGRIVYHGPISPQVANATVMMKATDLRDDEGLIYGFSVNVV